MLFRLVSHRIKSSILRNVNSIKNRTNVNSFSSSSSSFLLEIRPEVQEALNDGRPIVALESTIVAHGMPYPQNVAVAREVESLLRERGVTPATIALHRGRAKIGLSDAELEQLAKAGARAAKCSTREIGLFLAKHPNGGQSSGGSSSRSSNNYDVDDDDDSWGATTVASTMALAHRAGIHTFVTGGIGGVHRDGHVSMDVSADLLELSRTPVIVVSAGIKSILDIERTLENLETLAVPTVTYRADEFPAFFSPASGVPTPWRVDSVNEIVRAYLLGATLTTSSTTLQHQHTQSGVLVAVPNHDSAGQIVEDAIQEALRMAQTQGIVGQKLTPFILKTVAEQTGGESLHCNITLVKNNAVVGAEIATALAFAIKQQLRPSSIPQDFTSTKDKTTTTNNNKKRVIIVGGAVIDLVARPKEGTDLIAATSNPGTCTESDGGVGRNVAEALGRLGCQPILYTAIGNDARGKTLRENLQNVGGLLVVNDDDNDSNNNNDNNNTAIIPQESTATYLAVLNSQNDLHTAVADMDILDKIRVPPRSVFEEEEQQCSSQFLILDANPPLSVLRETAALAATTGNTLVCLEPTSVPKARVIAQDPSILANLSYAFPNADELVAMADSVVETDIPASSFSGESTDTADMAVLQIKASVVLGMMYPREAHLVITLGERGVLLATRRNGEKCIFHHFPAKENLVVKNSTGAGDSLCGAFIAALMNGKSQTEAVEIGMEAANLSLCCSKKAVSPKLSTLTKMLQ